MGETWVGAGRWLRVKMCSETMSSAFLENIWGQLPKAMAPIATHLCPYIPFQVWLTDYSHKSQMPQPWSLCWLLTRFATRNMMLDSGLQTPPTHLKFQTPPTQHFLPVILEPQPNHQQNNPRLGFCWRGHLAATLQRQRATHICCVWQQMQKEAQLRPE